ncbi:carboxymuconolactone decarboxylase family protein [Veillonella sp. R32]|uniref:carboxymuconolactone decarboxylase family protein n=1 Tax=Veillonella sp. R32 TaxID=2021312 RepID=UPI00138941D7|nr:carboxymuconolactone decarboxylase family protein [Veillonella sp. R32]KAF1683154.1 hypothetical protein VER_03465 [Veillonella sp. R32]
MKQTNIEKLSKAQELLSELKTLRGGSVTESHCRMGNDPNLVQAFINQYTLCNKKGQELPTKYRELIVMAIGMATGTEMTTKVHAKLAYEAGATVDEICHVIRILFFTCGITKVIPALEVLEAIEFEKN